MAGVSSWQARQSGTGNELSRRGASWDFSVSSNACGSLRCPATKTSVEKRREPLPSRLGSPSFANSVHLPHCTRLNSETRPSSSSPSRTNRD
ncbi:hypothetical protein HZH68_003625 [Vespula germanica]|uniref:Uncharacterized protein n=1 Tax=Vespula germanica TaxID=30212 RepID=A0A834U3H4_VESGE|nr:hypothetical protein HZH68_003625 [Vespula germanica]